MKKLILFTLWILVACSLSGQSLVDIYKRGTVKLVPDKEYARNNDWEKVFVTYYDTIYGKPMGNRKSIVLMPDGSVIVNHAYRNYYSLFDPNGKFVRELGVFDSNGTRFQKTNAIEGIINNNTFFTGLDNMGKMLCFDFEGKYKKTLTLDYMARDMVSLDNNKIAVVGWVLWKTKFRDFVAIVDYSTNEQKVIWEHFTDRCDMGSHCKMFNYSYAFEKHGMFTINTMPFTKYAGLSAPPQIEYVNDKLVVAVPATGEISIYDVEGNLVSKDKIKWAANFISTEEQKKIQEDAIQRFKNIKEPRFASWVSPAENKKAQEVIVSQMEEDLKNISEPIPVPVFSTIIKDSDGNLLFFEIPKDEGANKFNVWIYRESGMFVCQSSFECDEYNLSITPSKMVFHDGYIYALQTLKEADGNPLRLVRFRIE